MFLSICFYSGSVRVPGQHTQLAYSYRDNKTYVSYVKKMSEKTFEGDLKKMELTWGTAKREAKERNSWRKRSSCIILNG